MAKTDELCEKLRDYEHELGTRLNAMRLKFFADGDQVRIGDPEKKRLGEYHSSTLVAVPGRDMAEHIAREFNRVLDGVRPLERLAAIQRAKEFQKLIETFSEEIANETKRKVSDAAMITTRTEVVQRDVESGEKMMTNPAKPVETPPYPYQAVATPPIDMSVQAERQKDEIAPGDEQSVQCGLGTTAWNEVQQQVAAQMNTTVPYSGDGEPRQNTANAPQMNAPSEPPSEAAFQKGVVEESWGPQTYIGGDPNVTTDQARETETQSS